MNALTPLPAMNLLVLSLCIVAAVARTPILDPHPPTWICRFVTDLGYSIRPYTVTTDDGYILQLFNLPPTTPNSNEREETKPPVLLVHGFLSSGEDFVYGGPSQGLAFKLVDAGYNVFIANTRGSFYGLNHTHLDSEKDPAFWKFSFHEVGVKDLPAIVDRTLEISQSEKLFYLGHTEGVTAFYILAAERPEYQEKIERAIALGPVAYLTDATQSLLKTVSEQYTSKSWVLRNLGTSTFKPSFTLLSKLQVQCLLAQTVHHVRICRNLFFLFNGFNSNQLNDTTVREGLNRLPASGSVQQVLHLAQIQKSKHFQTYVNPDTPDEIPHLYQLSKINVPVSIFSTPKDSVSQPGDVKVLTNELPKVYREEIEDRFVNNLDFIYGTELDALYANVINALKEYIGPDGGKHGHKSSREEQGSKGSREDHGRKRSSEEQGSKASREE